MTGAVVGVTAKGQCTAPLGLRWETRQVWKAGGLGHHGSSRARGLPERAGCFALGGYAQRRACQPGEAVRATPSGGGCAQETAARPPRPPRTSPAEAGCSWEQQCCRDLFWWTTPRVPRVLPNVTFHLGGARPLNTLTALMLSSHIPVSVLKAEQ